MRYEDLRELKVGDGLVPKQPVGEDSFRLPNYRPGIYIWLAVKKDDMLSQPVHFLYDPNGLAGWWFDNIHVVGVLEAVILNVFELMDDAVQ